MAPAASKRASGVAVATQADDAKYRSKYKELKTKVQEIDEDNTKLSVKILKSKKAIQRLRIERAILYDRLQSTTAPTNPYALSSAKHLSTLASSSTASTSTEPAAPLSILSTPSYALADPSAPNLFLQQLDGQKLAALQQANGGGAAGTYGEQPNVGVAGEGQAAKEHEALLAAGGPVNGSGATNGSGAAPAEGAFSAPAAPPAAVPQAVPVQAGASSAMQVDQ
ncbi:hypothetical protein JCM10207_003106 [Rhodosporidiobolus poonsookiae]